MERTGLSKYFLATPLLFLNCEGSKDPLHFPSFRNTWLNTIFPASPCPEPFPLECLLMHRTALRQGRRGTSRAFYPCLGIVLGIDCMKRGQADERRFFSKYNFLEPARCSASVGPLQLKASGRCCVPGSDPTEVSPSKNYRCIWAFLSLSIM